MAVSGGLSYLLNLSSTSEEGKEKGSVKNLYKELNPLSYVSAGATGTSKLISNTSKGLTDTIYAFGKTIDNYLGHSGARTAETPAPAGGGGHT